ncbi:MAG: precorrin-6x reductase [Actinomycetia bacterium]|nr:precorrin-6x reductase [Actinomycetes bacterium]
MPQLSRVLLPRRVLVLGGTAEGRELAAALHAAGIAVVSSLAGRVTAPRLPPGEIRIGGFGGPDGLARYLREHRITAVADATHPFAAAMTASAVAACAQAGVPLVVLRRPGWTEQPGDDWLRVPSLAEAARAVTGRVFLTVGRQGLAPFADRPDCWFLIRSVDPPAPPLPAHHRILLSRGPFTLPAERDLLREHRIGTLVTKDSGGALTAAKLGAARELGIAVVMVDRPPPPAAPLASTTAGALRWIDDLP